MGLYETETVEGCNHHMQMS